MYKAIIYTNMYDLTTSNNIKEYEITSPITYTSRSDANFDEIQFELYANHLENVQPYTLCKIVNENGVALETASFNEQLWVCSSEVVSHNGMNLHKFRLLDPTCLLSNYVLGTKVFSNNGYIKTDNQKVDVLCDIINQKYNLNDFLRKAFFFGSDTANGIREYQFGSGTTLYEAICEIAKNWNAVPKATLEKEEVNGIEKVTHINIYFDSQKEINDINKPSIYTIDNSKVQSINVSQDIDTFTNGLELEARNVVGNNENYVGNLTLRSNKSYFNNEGGMLILPSKIAEIKELGVVGKVSDGSVKFFLRADQFKDKYLEDYSNAANGLKDTKAVKANLLNTPYTLADWNTYLKENSELEYLLEKSFPTEKILEKEKTLKTWKKLNFKLISSNMQDGNVWLYTLVNANDDDNQEEFQLTINITNRIVEKSRYDLLYDTQKVEYCYWEYNKNYIDGLVNYYKTDDVLNTIINSGINQNALGVFKYGYNTRYDHTNGISIGMEISINNLIKDGMFTVKYIPINNMYLKANRKPSDYLNISSQNVQKQTIYRSYNQNGDIVEYNKLLENLKESASLLGCENVTYDLVNIEWGDLPVLKQQVRLFNQQYYINLIQATYYPNTYSDGSITIANKVTLNLNRKKVNIFQSEAIETQYHSTKNPTEDIVDRYIYFEAPKYSSTQINPTDELYLAFDNFYDYNNSYIAYQNAPTNGLKTEDTWIRLNILKNEDGIILVGQTEDYYSLGSYIVNDTINNKGTKVVMPVNYVDANNEMKYFRYRIVRLNGGISKLMSQYLPFMQYGLIKRKEIVTNFRGGISYESVLCHKDARERLIFVIKLK